MRQLELDLGEGWHVGPLFIAAKRRAPRLRSAFDGSRRIWGILRRGVERRATPAWLTPQERLQIRAWYKLARAETRRLGVRQSVDHIVPLVDPRVCGLHVPWNLGIKPLVDNVAKGTSWWPDMPEEQAELL